MTDPASIFQLFGGIRPMARELGEPSSNVAAWKKVGRIPAEKQAHVLAVSERLGLPITAENVVFPLGRPASEVALATASVACNRIAGTQRNGATK